MVTKTGADRRKPLTRGRIVDAAFTVIEREGLEAFSTRRLARELDCEAMSIYHYFPSKAHLMDALVDRFIEQLELPEQSTPWRQRFDMLVAEMRRCALARPEFFRFFAIHRLNTPGGLGLLDWMLGIWFDAGFEPEMAARLFRLTGYYVTGGLLDETSGYAKGPSAVDPPGDDEIVNRYPRIATVGPYFRKGSFEPTFDLGIAILRDAYERALAEQMAGGREGSQKRQT